MIACLPLEPAVDGWKFYSLLRYSAASPEVSNFEQFLPRPEAYVSLTALPQGSQGEASFRSPLRFASLFYSDHTSRQMHVSGADSNTPFLEEIGVSSTSLAEPRGLMGRVMTYVRELAPRLFAKSHGRRVLQRWQQPGPSVHRPVPTASKGDLQTAAGENGSSSLLRLARL
jgi:hypothetical protein